MILVDTSVWVEYLRDSGHPSVERLDGLLRMQGATTCEPVVCELLVGAGSAHQLRALRDRLIALPLLSINGLEDWELAAAIRRDCRRAGETVRGLLDCLIAAVAIREGVPVLHADRDFDAIARHSRLQIAP